MARKVDVVIQGEVCWRTLKGVEERANARVCPLVTILVGIVVM